MKQRNVRFRRWAKYDRWRRRQGLTLVPRGQMRFMQRRARRRH